MIDNLFIREIKLNKNLFINEESYVFNLPIIQSLKQLKFNKKVTFFVGENGTGKSTLLEAIAINYGFNPEGGSKNFNFLSQDIHSPLYKYITISKGTVAPKDGFFLRAESLYNVAKEIDRVDAKASYGGKSLHEQSHGESFLSLVINRFRGNGLYILDEPEAALSPVRQYALLGEINELVNNHSQFIIVTHSPILLAFPNADIFVFNDNQIKLTSYEETEHYVFTKEFLNNRQVFLKHLLD